MLLRIRFIRLVLFATMRNQCVGTIPLSLLTIVTKVIYLARNIVFNLCSNYPYKNEFYEIFLNVRKICLEEQQLTNLTVHNCSEISYIEFMSFGYCGCK